MYTIRRMTPDKPAEFPPRSFLLYGQPKVGKTSTAASFPVPLFISLEDGVHNVTADVIQEIADVKQLKGILEDLDRDLRSGKLPHRTIILDGLTTFITAAITKEGSKDSRQTAKKMAQAFIPVLQVFCGLPGVIRIITMHTRETQTETTVTVEGHTKTNTSLGEEPDVSPRIRTFMTGYVDAIGYCHTVANVSVVDWLPTDTQLVKIVAGNRLGLPRQTQLSFQAIAKALTASPVVPAKAHPVTSASIAEAPKVQASISGHAHAQAKPAPDTKPAPFAGEASVSVPSRPVTGSSTFNSGQSGRAPVDRPAPSAQDRASSETPGKSVTPQTGNTVKHPLYGVSDTKQLAGTMHEFMVPSEAAVLVNGKNGANVFWAAVQHFKLDQNKAKPLANSCAGDWKKAVIGLDGLM